MKITASVNNLKHAITCFSGIADGKQATAHLGYAKIVPCKEGLKLSATDRELSVEVIVDAHVEEHFKEFFINIKTFGKILQASLPNKNVEMTESGNTLKINIADTYYSMLIYKDIDYPPFEFNFNNSFNLNGDILFTIINKVFHAISNDETRPSLNGVYFHQMNNKIRAVSTDGFRLALFETEIDVSDKTLPYGIIVPKKGIVELKRMAEHYRKETIRLSTSESFIYANAGDKHFLSVRLIAREYPNYQLRIPSKTSFRLKVQKEHLYNALRRTRIMCDEKSHGVVVKFMKNNMAIKAQDSSLGDAYEEIPVDYKGKEMEMVFNASYLMDSISHIEEGDVCWELNNAISAVLIKDFKTPKCLELIMPRNFS